MSYSSVGYAIAVLCVNIGFDQKAAIHHVIAVSRIFPSLDWFQIL
jgi:hypothetical protein